MSHDGSAVAAARFDAFVARRIALSDAESTSTTRLHRLAKDREEQFVSWYRRSAEPESDGGGDSSAWTLRAKVLHSVAALPMPFEVAVDGLARKAASAASWQEQLRDTCATARKEGCHPGALPSMQNVVCSGNSYLAAQQHHRRLTAGKQLLKWIRFSVNRYRLLASMRSMIQASAEGRRKRYEAAARRIQPLWRGAWTRMRLKRALKPVEDPWDDDIIFAKREDIDAEIEALEAAITNPRLGAAQIVRKTALRGATSATLFELAPEPRPPLDPRPSSTSGFNARPVIAPLSQAPRPSSMPLNQSNGGGSRTPNNTNRGSHHAQPLQPSSSLPAAPPSTEESEWGDVAAQIRKRDAKRQDEKRRNEAQARLRR